MELVSNSTKDLIKETKILIEDEVRRKEKKQKELLHKEKLTCGKFKELS